MSVAYRGPVPKQNYTVNDFYNKGVVISLVRKFKDYYTQKPMIGIVFRSNGLLGEIRSTGDSFAIDVQWGWWSNEQTCLTTECKSLREAKSILYTWFESKGFVIPDSIVRNDWSKATLRFSGQLNLNPIIFR